MGAERNARRGAFAWGVVLLAVLAGLAIGAWWFVRAPRPIPESKVYMVPQDTTYWSVPGRVVLGQVPHVYTIAWWEPAGSGGWRHAAITVNRDTLTSYLNGEVEDRIWPAYLSKSPMSVLTDTRYRSVYYAPEALSGADVRILYEIGRYRL